MFQLDFLVHHVHASNWLNLRMHDLFLFSKLMLVTMSQLFFQLCNVTNHRLNTLNQFNSDIIIVNIAGFTVLHNLMVTWLYSSAQPNWLTLTSYSLWSYFSTYTAVQTVLPSTYQLHCHQLSTYLAPALSYPSIDFTSRYLAANSSFSSCSI